MARIVWLDLETTGLDPHRDTVLAAAVKVTDGFRKKIATMERYVHVADPSKLKMSEYVRKMHTDSGLFEFCKLAPTWMDEMALGSIIAAFVQDHAGPRSEAYLAGSSIHFDRSFLVEHMPAVLDFVSHRQIDVSTLKVLAGIIRPDDAKHVRESMGEPRHLPMDDIVGSERELETWVRLLFGVPALMSFLEK